MKFSTPRYALASTRVGFYESARSTPAYGQSQITLIPDGFPLQQATRVTALSAERGVSVAVREERQRPGRGIEPLPG